MKFYPIKGYECASSTITCKCTCVRLGVLVFFALLFSIYPHTIIAQPFIAVGNYFGNGVSGREITDVGFTPDMVMIKGNTNSDAVIKINTMSGSLSKRVTVNVAANNNGITELTTNGFRITNDVTVNSNGIDYYWVAVRNMPGLIVTGSYTGNNTDNRNISGIGFSPDYLMIFPESANNASMKFPLPASDYTLPFHGNNSGIANAIQSLNSDGFQVGTDVSVNANNVIYHYVAFKADSTNIIIGNYAGDGTDGRWISTPITPTYLLIRSNANTFPFQKLATLCGDAAFNFHNQDAYVNTIQSFGIDGFEIGGSSSVNHQNRHYYYFALKGTITGEDCFSLPIELVSFEGSVVDNHVKLEWTTLSEMNNDFFTVEKSRDAINFELVGMVKGAGFSNTTLYYSFTDTRPYSGTSYYRLKQTDFDGGIAYSRIVPVKFDIGPDIKVFPNPSNGLFVIDGSNIKDDKLQLVVYDVLARKIFSNEIRCENAQYMGVLDLVGYPSGTYSLILTGKNYSRKYKIVIQ